MPCALAILLKESPDFTVYVPPVAVLPVFEVLELELLEFEVDELLSFDEVFELEFELEEVLPEPALNFKVWPGWMICPDILFMLIKVL